MQIPRTIRSRARQHLHSLLYRRRYFQTVPPRALGTSLNIGKTESHSELSHGRSQPSSTQSTAPNDLIVAAPRTYPSTLPVGLLYKFHPGSSFFAKRPARPFPPPFNLATPPASTPIFRDAFRNFHFNLSLGRGSNSDEGEGRAALSAAHAQEDALGFLRGITNGDDAAVSAPYYLGVADGVGAWNTRPQGYAALWSRLILHFWALEIEQQILCYNKTYDTSPANGVPLLSSISALQASYEITTAITLPAPFLGTTTACLALLLPPTTLLLTNVGDSQAFVFRPSEGRFIARTEEQWHWFDCPRQLGTNSPDVPKEVGQVVEVQVKEGDLVLLATDGLMDNLWETEVVQELMKCVESGEEVEEIAEKLVKKAKVVAGDPWGLSPYMERAVDQGLGIEGGKWDDITVVVARCQQNS